MGIVLISRIVGGGRRGAKGRRGETNLGNREGGNQGKFYAREAYAEEGDKGREAVREGVERAL